MQSVQPKTNWNLLVYASGDNAWHRPLYQGLNDLEDKCDRGDVRVLALLDQPGIGARVFQLRPDGQPDRLTSPIVAEHGMTDMACPSDLRDFVTWAQEAYPSEHTALVVSSPSGNDTLVCDQSHKQQMTSQEMHEALQAAQLETGRKLDVLGLDVGNGTTLEVLSPLSQDAEHLVASSAPQSGPWNLADAVGRFPQSRLTAKTFAATLVHSEIPNVSTLSSLQSSKLPKVDACATSLLNCEYLRYSHDVIARSQALGPDRIDLGDLALQASTDHGFSSEPKDRRIADRLSKAIQAAVAEHWASRDLRGSTGLAITVQQAKLEFQGD
jgi:hypothetical protein